MNLWAQGEGQPGLGYIFWREGRGRRRGPLAKNMARLSAQKGVRNADRESNVGKDARVLHCRSAQGGSSTLAGMGAKIGGTRPDRPQSIRVLRIVDFPMYEWWNEEEKEDRLLPQPVPMPHMAPEDFLALDPGRQGGKIISIKAFQYGHVCNASSFVRARIRNIARTVMRKALRSQAGYDEACWSRRSAALLRALSLGGPRQTAASPPASTRIVMLLCGEEGICARRCCSRLNSVPRTYDGAPSDG